MYDFSASQDRRGTWCTQWDYIGDRFGAEDLLPFTISDMDFATAPCVIEALERRLSHGVFGYSRWRHAEFLDALAGWYARRFHCRIDTTMAVFAPSVIYMAAQLIRQWSLPGQGVVVHTPAYDAFYHVVAANGRRLLPSPLRREGDEWRCDMAHLETLLARPDAKVLLLCNPHNPTGKVWSRDELRAMADLCERHGVRVISDEIHMDMVWEGAHIPWSEVATTAWALLTSASKSFNIPALTGAYGFISDDGARNDFSRHLKAADGLSSPAVLSVAAHIAAYEQGGPWLDELRDYLLANLRYAADRLNQAFPQLRCRPPQSTYLAWIDLRALNVNDGDLQRILIDREKLAIMPGLTYGIEGQGFLRLNAGCPRAKIARGVAGLISALRRLAAG
ncbi:MalY/PatB family protein [Sodalis sp. RH21]|uniref:MalY/PatB family protein n=1 Tax=unclassified Sodalis (in: enterobacteria) TaxID=2636512 RepID=UPI0039B5F8F8